MMLQSIVAAVIVVACGAHVGRAIWRGLRSRGRPACGGCSNCGSTKPPEAVITIRRQR